MKKKEENYQLSKELEMNISAQYKTRQVSVKHVKYLLSFDNVTMGEEVSRTKIRQRATTKQLCYAIQILQNGGFVTIN